MYRTLILTQQYTPHEIVDWKDSLARIFNGKVDVVAQYEEVLTRISRRHLADFPELCRSLRMVMGGLDVDSVEINVPAVVVLRKPVLYNKSKEVKYNKMGLALRDNFCCQYCGKRFHIDDLTKDHVVPRDLGGASTWDNVVMACQPCNSLKANKPLHACGLKLLRKPFKPKSLPIQHLYVDYNTAPEEWKPFLTANSQVA
jgi:5-methylcytosine-specific restriction endonuclease McrA